MTASARLAWLADPDALEPIGEHTAPSDPLRFRVGSRYRDRLARAEKDSGAREALLSARLRLAGRRLVAAVTEPGFLGASFGAVAAARLLAALEAAADHRHPMVFFAAGGGPRVAEGAVGLAGLPLIADRRAALYSEGVAFVSVLCPPTPTGALLALALSADVVLTEPLGARAHPPGSPVRGDQEQGLVDRQVARSRLRDEVREILDLLDPAG